jgi:hypothetical protein
MKLNGLAKIIKAVAPAEAGAQDLDLTGFPPSREGQKGDKNGFLQDANLCILFFFYIPFIVCEIIGTQPQEVKKNMAAIRPAGRSRTSTSRRPRETPPQIFIHFC